MDAIALRPSELGDEEWLFALHEAAHRDLVERAYGPWDDEQQRAFFKPVIDDHDVFVVQQETRSVGAVYLGLREGDTWIELVEVAPDSQGRGVGSQAVEWVLARSAAAGRGTRLQVHKVNEAAHRLYLRLGFVPTAETVTHHVLRHP